MRGCVPANKSDIKRGYSLSYFDDKYHYKPFVLHAYALYKFENHVDNRMDNHMESIRKV